MSLLRLPKIREVGAACERMWNSVFAGERRESTVRKPRRLRIDALEERQLLSVSPVSASDMLINQTTTYWQYMLAGKSVATDADGDFVATWTRWDDVLDASGNYIMDPATGYPMTDANIYARYFTNAVQTVTLPSDLSTLPIDPATGLRCFSLNYTGNAIQQLNITAGVEPFKEAQSAIQGTFSLWLDVNGDGIPDAGEVTDPIEFDEMMFVGTNVPRTALDADLDDVAMTLEVQADTQFPSSDFVVAVGDEHIRISSTDDGEWTIEERGVNGTTISAHVAGESVVFLDPAAQIQHALRKLGGALADVVVTGTDSQAYTIAFGDASNGEKQPQLAVVSPNYTSGFLVAAEVTTVRSPGTTIPILISSDPNSTAANIEYAFSETTTTLMAPVVMPPLASVPPSGPYYFADVKKIQVSLPSVSVRALNAEGTQFEITFTGEAGKLQQPLLEVITPPDADTGDYEAIAGASVKIVKQTSDEFRVNAPETDDSTTTRLDFYDQTDAQVVMTPDGDFVITWAGEVPNSKTAGSVTDIFARRFSPAAWVDTATTSPYLYDMDHDGVAETPIQGVVPLGNEFRVNTNTANPQSFPSIGIDASGNFTVVWQSEGQGLSFFNLIQAQRFDRYGNRLGTEFTVNSVDTTTINFEAYVAVSQDGVIAVAWTNTNDPNYLLDNGITSNVYAKVYASDGAVLLDQFYVNGGGNATIAFDSASNFVISNNYIGDRDNLAGSSLSNGVYAQQYQVWDASGQASGTLLRTEFRVNSANFNPNANAYWPADQNAGQAAVDADGDITISYDGYGADISQADVTKAFENSTVAFMAYFGQSLSFATSDFTNGYFRLRVGGVATDDILFDFSNINGVGGTAERIQEALDLIEPGAKVEFASFSFSSGVATYRFQITFAESATTYSRPLITLLAPIDPAHTATPLTATVSGKYNNPDGLVRLDWSNMTGDDLLRGEAYAAMFTQLDADPRLASLTILNTDSVANNNRDGQDTTFYLDIDPNVTSGNFTLKVTIPAPSRDAGTTLLEASVNITPVIDPNSETVDADATVEAIHNALSSLGILGRNWPQTAFNDPNGFEGPIYVRLLSAGELAAREDTPWDPAAAGINTSAYVYEITFMGEVHDMPVTVARTANTMKLKADTTSLQQTLTFAGTAGMTGWFQVRMGTILTDPIYFNGNNTSAVASAITSALRAADSSFAGATCVFQESPEAGTYVFLLTFATPQGPASLLSYMNVPLGFTGLNATMSSELLGSNAPNPTIVCEYYGDLGTPQYGTSLSMTPEGSFVMVWNEDALLNGGATLFSDSSFGDDSSGLGDTGTGSLFDIGLVSTTNFYYREFSESADTAGPTVTRVTGGNSYISNDTQVTTESGLQHIVVTFSEAMYDNFEHTGNAVTNPANYQLLLNGAVVNGAILKVEYGLNKAAELAAGDPTNYGDLVGYAAANRLEAVITIDGNGNLAGTPLLDAGVYTVRALAPVQPSELNPEGSTGLIDLAGNALGYTGYKTSGVSFTRSFSVLVTSSSGGSTGNLNNTEFLVNQTTTGNQTIGTAYGAGTAKEYNGRAVAVDHSGNFAVVWVSYGQDGVSDPSDPNFDPNAATSAGVYVRMYDRNNVPLTGEILVNTFTKGDQMEPSIAMDADGDFVVVWSSKGQDNVDASWGIFGQRFNSMGQKVGSEFQVNTNTTGDQVAPSVSMNSFGSFVVVWATKGQSYSYFNDIHAQVFNAEGQKSGSELRVNSENISGTSQTPSANELHPVVAMADNGRFVVAWDAVIRQLNGVALDSVVMARLFDRAGNPVSINGNNVEFQVNVGNDAFVADPQHSERLNAQGGTATTRLARNAQVAMDAVGNFIVAWESYQDNDVVTAADSPDSYGIYYRRFSADGTPVFDEDSQANLTITALDTATGYTLQQAAPFAGAQVNPSIAMDADGDFAVVWDGNGAMTDPLDAANLNLVTNRDTQGVWIRRFDAGDSEGVSEAVGVQSRVNMTQSGAQRLASIAMTPSGDCIVVWSGNGIGDTQGVYARRYDMAEDNAGPMVTGFLLPDGSSVINSVQVTQSVQAIVLTFDEELDAATASNPANYQLLKDGVLVSGGISQALYGLDIANTLGSQYGLNVPKTNKYQVVLVVDANGATSGVLPLSDGNYQVVVLNAITDKVGNPLLSIGPGPNGNTTSGTINITLPTGQETRVGSGYTSATTPNPADGGLPATPEYSAANAVASDADGDYVVVWSDTTAGHQGVWAKMYKQTSTLNADGTRTTTVAAETVVNPTTGLPWANNEILISADPTASDVSVDRDVDGDFVVTWSTWNSATSWDVWAQRYDAAGKAQGSAFRVNAETKDAQRYSSVAMDAEGNFVVTWQSNGQDGSGYGIYAQCYSAAGAALGGANELQVLSFTNNFTGTFRLSWDDDNNAATAAKVTAPISHSGNAYATASAIESALAAIGAKVKVTAYGLSDLLIEFVDASGHRNQALLVATDLAQTGGANGAQVSVYAFSEGVAGEFRVNDTTLGDQTFPDVACSAAGDFVITWTSVGQNGDSQTQTNIYAKRYGSTSTVWAADNTVSLDISRTAATSRQQAEPLMTTVGDPDDYVVDPTDTAYNGVVQILSQDGSDSFSGSGSLLAGTNWILTAAHVVWSDINSQALATGNMMVAFDLPGGRELIPVTQVIVHPGYTGDVSIGYDLALVQILYVPTGVQGFEIYTGYDEVGQIGQVVGYGITGTGTTGAIDPNVEDLKRTGYNRLDATGDLLGYLDTMLVTDFDDGTALHDAFGQLYGIADLGLGVNEVSPAHGDSGGPMLVGFSANSVGKIAGVCSFINTAPGPQDILQGLNESYGEFVFYVRVSAFSGWINSITAVRPVEFLVNANDVVAVNAQGQRAVLDNNSGNQSHSSVAMDANGDFVIAWTSYGHDGVGSGYGAGFNGENGVFARRYSAGFDPTTAQPGNVFLGDATQASDAFQVNQVAADNQQNVQVAMDADGDFMITWESFQDGSPATSYGIYARRYARTSEVGYASNPNSSLPLLLLGTNPLLGTNGEMGGEIAVNVTKTGDQRFPGIAMDDAGDAVIVWSGYGATPGQEDAQGVFFQRFARPNDTAGPTVGSVSSVVESNGQKSLVSVADMTVMSTGPSQFVVTFGEQLSVEGGSSGTYSVLNPANWQLTRNGQPFAGVKTIEYGLNKAYELGLTSTPSNKYEAVITFDGDSTTAGNQALKSGRYQLSISDSIQDIFGNALDGDYNGAPGTYLVRTFTVPSSGSTDEDIPDTVTPPGDPSSTDTDIQVNTYLITAEDSQPDVATDSNGNYVVVWKAYTASGVGLIQAQRFNRYGQPLGSEFNVSSTATGDRGDPAVAMDSYGNFVVVWTGRGADDEIGVYAQVFDKDGYPSGTEFRVNQYAANAQNLPDVAMTANGFIVTWTSYGQAADVDGVWARQFNLQGQALGGEFLVNTTTSQRQEAPRIAVDGAGNFVIVWQSWAQTNGTQWQWEVFGQRFSATGAKLGSEFQINTYQIDKQVTPCVAMTAGGDFVVAWSSMAQDGSGWGIYARRYSATGAAKDAQEFLVNQTTSTFQWTPDIGIAGDGSFTITWSSFGQDNRAVTNSMPTSDYGIYARKYNADGSDYRNPTTGQAYGEFRINATTLGDQTAPAISVTSTGNCVVVWQGPDGYGGLNVFTRVIQSSASSSAASTQGPTISKIVVAEENVSTRNNVLTSNERLVLTWNLVDADGIKSVSLLVDNSPVTLIYGPYSDGAGGANYAGAIGLRTAGTHTYVITATDKLGNITTYSGSFTVDSTEASATNAGPTIGSVVTPTTASNVLSWNLQDSDGIKSTSITVGGKNMTTVYGPYNASNGGWNYSTVVGSLGSGSYTYVITATDKLGVTTQKTGSFTVTSQQSSTTNTGPTIGSVVTPTVGNSVLTWNLLDSDGIKSTSLTVDNKRVATIYGPYNASNGGWNYAGLVGTLSAGTHTYTITATDKQGKVTERTGSFSVTSSAIAAAQAVYASIGNSVSSISSAKTDWLYEE